MTAEEILIPKIRAERLFPELLPSLNNTSIALIYLTDLRRRLSEWKPKYRFQPRYIPALEELLFYQDILAEEGEKTDEIVAEKLFRIFLRDRKVIVEVMKVLDFDVGIPHRSGNTFVRLNRKYLNAALQELSKERGDGRYVITFEEIPGLDYEEGIDLLVKKIVSRYRIEKGIPQVMLTEPGMTEPVTESESIKTEAVESVTTMESSNVEEVIEFSTQGEGR